MRSLRSFAVAEFFWFIALDEATLERLLLGPPGTGKSMLANRLPTILPPLTLEEALETTKIHGIVGLLAPGM